ncbi:MAG: MBL fold metallo-hydrolase, partial [Actinobacteria bacterium]|nr:MBL fold metallo-hydrolase [Actinomycetota bacterium]
CSGYLVRDGATTLWLDAGNGTFANLQEHVAVEDLTAVVVTHLHPDHCVDLYSLHVYVRYGSDLSHLPVYAPPDAERLLGALVSDWGDAFDWHTIDDGATATLGELALRFSRTDHPPPTFATELTGPDKRLVYTSDTGPGWSVEAFAPGADAVLSEATYVHHDRPTPIHLSAREAGEAARAARARRLVLTHLWPQIDPVTSIEEATESFGAPVTLAAPHLVVRI